SSRHGRRDGRSAILAARNFKCLTKRFPDIQVVTFALRGDPTTLVRFVLDKSACLTQIRRASSTPPGAPPEGVAFRGELPGDFFVVLSRVGRHVLKCVPPRLCPIVTRRSPG